MSIPDHTQNAVDAAMAGIDLDIRPGDRMPWKAWERATWWYSWRLSAAGMGTMIVGLQTQLYAHPWFMPVAMVMINFCWLALIAFLPAFARWCTISNIVNPPSPNRHRRHRHCDHD